MTLEVLNPCQEPSKHIMQKTNLNFSISQQVAKHIRSNGISHYTCSNISTGGNFFICVGFACYNGDDDQNLNSHTKLLFGLETFVIFVMNDCDYFYLTVTYFILLRNG